MQLSEERRAARNEWQRAYRRRSLDQPDVQFVQFQPTLTNAAGSTTDAAVGIAAAGLAIPADQAMSNRIQVCNVIRLRL